MRQRAAACFVLMAVAAAPAAMAAGISLPTALQIALESHASGAALTWSDGPSARGQVVPMKTYKSKTGLWCRTFAIHTAGTKANPEMGTACRVNGRWIEGPAP